MVWEERSREEQTKCLCTATPNYYRWAQECPSLPTSPSRADPSASAEQRRSARKTTGADVTLRECSLLQSGVRMRVAAAALIVLLCAHDAAGFSLAQSLHGSPAQHSVQRRDGTERLARAPARVRQRVPRLLPLKVIASSRSATEPEALEARGADGHPIRVWRKGPANGKPIVLLHGRTWSARPVWDLQVGSPPRDGASELGASMMDLLAAQGYQSWAPDFRGLGGTARDARGWTTPDTCLADMKAVLDLMAVDGKKKPPIIGWSQGAMVAQMVAQKYPDLISHAVLYASIFDPNLKYPPPAKGAPGLLDEAPPHIKNTMEGAMEDWTVPGIIDDEAAQAFGTEALKWDARKVSWNGLDQFNVCDPAKVTVPTLVIHGEKDWYTSMDKQAALFMGIASGNKAWRIIPGCDHPVHLYPKQRQQWLRSCLDFIQAPL